MTNNQKIQHKGERRYPEITPAKQRRTRPISFVVVKFSNEFEYNFALSPCAHDPLNQVVVIDNTANLYYSNLSVAINTGLDKAKYELICIIHEDVYLPEGWQDKFEESLRYLEEHHPDWGVVGVAGNSEQGKLVGHWSDPNTYRNSLQNQSFCAALFIDEHFMLVRKSVGLRADGLHPGIHGIGVDLVLSAKEVGLGCYIIDAPTIHKYKDATGNVIRIAKDSQKIRDRSNYAYMADKKCCDEYISYKWGKHIPFTSINTEYNPWESPEAALASELQGLQDYIDSPIILVAKGGGGSRLLAQLAADHGIYMGRINSSGDCLDMVMAIYQGVIEKYQCNAAWQKKLIVPRLRLAALRMLARANQEQRRLWGFKLPENLLILPELRLAFPEARYVHMIRRPIDICLRRTHMTARLDNQIGRITLPLAYRMIKRPITLIPFDSPGLHMAYTTLHQLRLGLSFFESLNRQGVVGLNLFFEEIINTPLDAMVKFKEWLGCEPISNGLLQVIDTQRIKNIEVAYSEEVVGTVKKILAPLQAEIYS